jgi:hypothetical protein
MLDLRREHGRTATADATDDAEPASMPRLPAWDREVIEVLVGVPEGAGLVVRQVEPADLETSAGRTVVEAARRLQAAGRSVGLSGLLLELTDPALQSLLVAIDEEAASRQGLEPRERIDHFAEAIRRRAAGRVARASARAIKTSRLDAGSEAELLERLVAQRRVAQGIAEPKEG